MLSDKLEEGMEVILDYKTADAGKVYISSVLLKEGSLIALKPCYDDKGNIEDFSDGDVSLSIKGSNTVIANLKIVPVLYHGEKIYLTYGNRDDNDDQTYHRASVRYPVNADCKANDREAKLIDVSDHGFGIILNHKYKNGLWVELKYREVKVMGKIMQSKEVGIDTYFYGCKVDDADISGPFERLIMRQKEEFEDKLNEDEK